MNEHSLHLLQDAYGDAFLKYVLAVDGDADVLTSAALSVDPRREEVVEALLQHTKESEKYTQNTDGLYMLTRVNMDHYVTEAGSSYANLLRSHAGGVVPELPTSSDPVLNEIFKLLIDVYPMLLMPDGQTLFHSHIDRVAYNRPERTDLENALLDDPELSKLSSDDGIHRIAMRSTGQGGSIQLSTLGKQQIRLAYAWANLEHDSPSVKDIAEKIEFSIQAVRKSIRGESVLVPCQIGLTGILLPEDCQPIDVGGVILRRATDNDHKIPHLVGLQGTLHTSDANGSDLEIHYAGDIIASLEIPYQVELGIFEDNSSLLNPFASIQEQILVDIENIQIALALAIKDDNPPLIVQSWQLAIDPLSHSALPSWRETWMVPNLAPRQLKQNQVTAWTKWTNLVRENRSAGISIALRRILRALGERNDPEDVLLDAVVVWENLVGGSQEAVLRITSALAWLLGSDEADRLERRGEYKDIYGLRSKIVHGSLTDRGIVASQARKAVEISLAALRELFENHPELLAMKSEERSLRLLLGAHVGNQSNPG